MPDFALLMAAGGKSLRFGEGLNKLIQPLGGATVIHHTLAAFAVRGDVPIIVIAADEALRQWIGEYVPLAADLLRAGRLRYAPSGTCRAHSVRNALEVVPETIDWVGVHDAARPLVSQKLIDRTIAVALAEGCAAAPALAVELTIKQATGPLPASVEKTIPREHLWALQTPQVMRRADLQRAFAQCPLPLEQITDDLQLLELIGLPAMLAPGERRNLKITTPQDLRLAQRLWEEQAGNGP